MNLSYPLTTKEKQLGILYLCIQLLVLPSLFQYGNRYWQLSLPLLNVLLQSVNVLFVMVILRKLFVHELKNVFRFPGQFAWGVVLGCIFYFAGYLSLKLIVSWLFPMYYNPNDHAALEMIRQSPGLMGLCTVVLAPIAEEALYRGVIFGTLYRRGRLLAYLASAGIFALIHVTAYLGTGWVTALISFALYLPAGLSLAFSYEKANSLYAPIVSHMLINLTTFLIGG